MKPQSPHDPWSRLVAAARTVRDERDASVPYGFSTRVAALAFAQEQRRGSLFERFALRAVALACLLALGSVALNYQALNKSEPVTIALVQTELPQVDDTVPLLDFSD